MSFFNLVLSVLVIGAVLFVFGQRAATGHQAASTVKLHSRSHYHGIWVAITSILPALLMLLVLGLGKDLLFQHWARDFFPPEVSGGDAVDRAIALAKISNVVDGIIFGEVEPWVQSAGEAWIRWESNTIVVANILVLGISLTGVYSVTKELIWIFARGIMLRGFSHGC